jgi:prepilin-type N-terminal cleavage/methylation domain-containing protein
VTRPNHPELARRSVDAARTRAFSLVEVLIVVAIIAVLSALGLQAAQVVRRQAKLANARTTVSTIVLALESYHQDETKHRYPMHEDLYIAPPPDCHLIGRTAVGSGYPTGLVGLLIDRNLLPLGSVRLTEDGRLLDPWDGQFRYHLRRPTPSANAARLTDWNWDAKRSREATWNEVLDRAAPFPYVFSLGPSGDASDAAGWVYHAR